MPPFLHTSLLLVSAIVPSLLLIWYFHSRDVHPEPQRVVWATFGLGVLATFPILAVELPVAHLFSRVRDPLLHGFLEATFTAAIPEECFKYLVITRYCMRHREFDEPMDGIVYGSVASLGFATLENILYVSQGGTGLAVLRSLTAVPAHAFMGAILGYYVGQSKFTPTDHYALLKKGLFYAVCLHALYDFPLLSMKYVNAAPAYAAEAPLAGVLVFASLGVLIFEWRWAVRLVNRLHAEQERVVSGFWGHWEARGAHPGDAYQLPRSASDLTLAESRHTVGDWIKMATGFLLVCGGGLMTMGFISIGFDPSKRAMATPGVFFLSWLIFSFAPLVLGALLYRSAVRVVARGRRLGPTRAIAG